jgi:hypothetical protein
MKMDIHVHLIGTDPGRGCMLGSKVSSGPANWALKTALGFSGVKDEELDDVYRERLLEWVEGCELDRFGLLALDGVYDDAGELDRARTQVMVGNDYCLEVCAMSEKLLPMCSVNPKRKDAIDELERVVELGAVGLKALPNSQDFDPSERAYDPFWRKVADLGLPIVTHTSFEHTIPPIDQRWGHPSRLVGPLEQGVKVIAAHCAGSGTAHPFREHYHIWEDMLRRYDNLWGDVSAMASISRFPYIHKVLANELATARAVFGSDYPVPVSPSVFLPQLGVVEVRRLSAIGNPLQRNLEVFRALGLPEASMELGWELLGPNKR